ncbi:hypothetical protein BH24ACT14_BH24ACT14_22680 [soil metagenome]
MLDGIVAIAVVVLNMAVIVPLGLLYLLLRQVRVVRPLACTALLLIGVTMGPVGAVAATAGVCWLQWDCRRGAGRSRPQSGPPRLSRAWAGPLREAHTAGERCHAAVATAGAGPLRDRLDDLLADVDGAVAEAQRLAARGDDIARARREVDAALSRQRRGTSAGSPGALGEALAAQQASVARLRTAETGEFDRLCLLVARLHELAAQIVELTVLPAREPGALAELNDEVAALQAATHEVAMADASLRAPTVPV